MGIAKQEMKLASRVKRGRREWRGKVGGGVRFEVRGERPVERLRRKKNWKV
jgi:hypothetical protein